MEKRKYAKSLEPLPYLAGRQGEMYQIVNIGGFVGCITGKWQFLKIVALRSAP
jgi:hypothetical protein